MSWKRAYKHPGLTDPSTLIRHFVLEVKCSSWTPHIGVSDHSGGLLTSPDVNRYIMVGGVGCIMRPRAWVLPKGG